MSHHRLIKDTFITLVALVVFGSTNFIFNVVVGRVYGSAFLGQVSTALSTALLLSYIVSTSFPGAVAKYTSEYLGRGEEKKANYVLKLALKYGIIILTIVFLLAFLFAQTISEIFNMPENLFLMALPIVLIYGIYMILKMAYYGFGKVKFYFKNEIVADALFFAALGAIILFNFKQFVYLPYISLYLVFIFTALYFFRDSLRVNLKSREVRNKMLVFAGISFVGTFSSMSMRSLSIMLSSMYVPHSDVGYLSAAMALSTVFFLFPNAIGRVFMPEFSYIFGRRDNKTITSLLNKSTDYLTVFITILNSLGIIFAPLLVHLFYGVEYGPSILLLQIFLVVYWPSMVGRGVISSLSGTKYVHIPNIISMIGLFLAIGLWTILIPIWGTIGVALGYLIESWIAMGFTFYFGYKYFNFEYKTIFKNTMWIVTILLIMAIVPVDLPFKIIFSLVITTVYSILNAKKIKFFVERFF